MPTPCRWCPTSSRAARGSPAAIDCDSRLLTYLLACAEDRRRDVFEDYFFNLIMCVCMILTIDNVDVHQKELFYI